MSAVDWWRLDRCRFEEYAALGTDSEAARRSPQTGADAARGLDEVSPWSTGAAPESPRARLAASAVVLIGGSLAAARRDAQLRSFFPSATPS